MSHENASRAEQEFIRKIVGAVFSERRVFSVEEGIGCVGALSYMAGCAMAAVLKNGEFMANSDAGIAADDKERILAEVKEQLLGVVRGRIALGANDADRLADQRWGRQ